MRWLKRIIITLFSVCAFIIITLLITVWILDNEDYRDITIFLVNNYSDVTLTIDGDFSVGISLSPEIQATSIHILDSNNNFEVDIATLYLSVALHSLFRKPLWIKNLTLNDITVTVKHTILDAIPTLELTQNKHISENLLIPVLEKILIRNVILNIEKKTSTLSEYATITNLSVNIDNINNRLLLESHGKVNNYKFKANATIGRMTELLTSTTPFPIKMNAQIANMKIAANGSIKQPISGEGLNLSLDMNTNDFAKVFRRNNNKIPYIGKLSIHTKIKGNLPNVSVENLDIHLTNNKKTDIRLVGSIAEIKTGKNTNINVSSYISDPKLFSWLLPDDWPKIESLTLNTDIKHDNVNYKLDNIKLLAVNKKGIKLNSSGYITIKNISKQAIKQMNLLISLNTTTTKSLTNLFNQTLPELGSIKGKTRLMRNNGKFSLQDIVVTVGSNKKVLFHATGRIKNITANKHNPVKDLHIELSAHANNSHAIELLLNQKLPLLNNINAKAILQDNNKFFSLKNILITSGEKSQPSVKISGVIDNIFHSGDIQLDTKFNIKTNHLLHSINKRNLPDLGMVKGSFLIYRKAEHTSLNNINITISKQNFWEVTALGNISNLLSDLNYSFQTSSTIHNWEDFKKLLPAQEFKMSSQSGTGTLTGNKNKIEFNNTFNIGKTHLTTNVSVTKKNKRYSINTNMQSSLLYLEDFGITPKNSSDNNTKSDFSINSKDNLFSQSILPLDKLKILDLTAKLNIKKISGANNYINSLDVYVLLKNGDLRIHPATLVFRDASLQLDVGISANKKYQSHMKLSTQSLDLGSLMSQWQKTPIIKGSMNVMIDINSFGNSLQNIANNSNGDIILVGENIEVLRKYTDLLTSDTLGWATSSIGLRKEYNKWDCSILKFKVNNKKLLSDAMIANGPEMRLEGELEINLNNETMDMSLWPNQKGSLWLNVQPVTIKGAIRNPKINVLTVGASSAARTYGELILAPQIFIPLRAWNYLNASVFHINSSKEGPCQKLEKELQANKVKEK